jgi:stage II sporulation protein E
MLGTVMSGRGMYEIKYITIYFFMGITAFFSNKIKSETLKLCTSFLSAFVGCTLYFLFAGASAYSFIVLTLEFIGAYLLFDYYKVFFTYFESKKIRKTMTRKELFSLSAVLLITFASVADLKIVYDVSMVGIVANVIILFAGLEFNTGICSVAGVLLGSVMGVANPEMLYCIGSYAVSSAFVSFGAKYGKTGAIASFILTNAFFTFYVNNSSYILVNIFEILIAGAVIYLIPTTKLKSIKRNIMVLMPTTKVKEAMRVEMVKKEAGERMKKLSLVFERMAYVITKNNKKMEIGQEKEEKMLVENVAQRVCRHCRNSKKCWVDNYKDTYKVVADLLKATKIRGWSEQYDVPPHFKNVCYNPSALVLETNKVYELYRVNTVWENKISESRKLINQQLCDVSRVVDGIAEEIENGYSFELEAEEKLIEFLDNLGVRVSEVSVLKEKEERYQINICVVECRRGNVCHLTIVPVAEKILKRRFYAEERE